MVTITLHFFLHRYNLDSQMSHYQKKNCSLLISELETVRIALV